MATVNTNDDLMKFLKGFKESMEGKIEDTKNAMEDKLELTRTSLEDKIDKTNKKLDGKLNNLELEVKKINEKIGESDEISKRMNTRLNELEREMKKSAMIRENSTKLKQQEEKLKPKETMINTRKQVETLETRDPLEMEETAETQEGPYRSMWAHELQQELRRVAETTGHVRQETKGQMRQLEDRGDKEKRQEEYRRDRREMDRRREEEEREERVPDCWEEEEDRLTNSQLERPAARKPKVRKPVTITQWFGEDSSSEESTDSTDSELNSPWQDVNRKRKNEEKRKRLKRKRKEKMERCSLKASHMVGVGPVTMESVEGYLNKGMSFEKAKVIALKDFLAENLGYIQDELDVLSVQETKFSKPGENILYVALSEKEQVKELHVRRAECRNDNLTIRNYVPPQFF